MEKFVLFFLNFLNFAHKSVTFNKKKMRCKRTLHLNFYIILFFFCYFNFYGIRLNILKKATK